MIDNIVSTTVFLTDITEFDRMNQVRKTPRNVGYRHDFRVSENSSGRPGIATPGHHGQQEIAGHGNNTQVQ
jgi:hypothetical protein